jgi:hypothetical protein
MRSRFLALVDMNEIQNTDACPNFDLANVIYSYNQSRYSGEKKVKVKLRTRSNSLKQWGKRNMVEVVKEMKFSINVFPGL